VQLAGMVGVTFARVELGELRVFAATADGGATDTSTNWALGRPIATLPTVLVADSCQLAASVAPCASGPAELAVDGDECTFAYLRNTWADNGGNLGVEVELPMPLPVRSVVLVPPRSGLTGVRPVGWMDRVRVILLDERGVRLANATASRICVDGFDVGMCDAAAAVLTFDISC
jgi:hypothetical protein